MNERIYYSHEAEMRAMRERMLAVGIFMALGLGIGAVLALLFAPKSGEQLRRELASTLEESVGRREAQYNALQRLEKEFADLRKRVEERLEHMR
jgi:gas vesicle protein